MADNKKIAKNTILLYTRTFFVMIISIYTSRAVLHALGIEDYGVYQVVGGLVAMFSVVSTILTASISRYITFEIGSGNQERLYRVFSTCRIVLIILTFIVFVLTEIIGLWFLENMMNIPAGRMNAAIWVLHCSVISFCMGLLAIPYNACVIAHEHMKTFAYISILDAILKLLICFLLIYVYIDKLILYAILMMAISITIRIIYTLYCRHYFLESRAPIHFHPSIFKEILSFAGWNFLTSANIILCTHGINLLINFYFGVTFNAARGLANQVRGAVSQFVSSFMVAINPQITKSYASGDMESMYMLVCRGARFSYYLVLLMALPIIFEAESILNIWLVEVPYKTVVFVRLSLINILLDGAGYTSYTANLATGKIKKYSIILAATTILVFPLTWIAFTYGLPAEYAYYIEFLSQIIFHIARMYLTEINTGLKVKVFLRKVYIPIIRTTMLSIIPFILIIYMIPQSYVRLFVSVLLGTSIVLCMVSYVGISKTERNAIIHKVMSSAREHFIK